MAREVKDQEKVKGELPADEKASEGTGKSVTFIKNQVNEVITLPNGTTFRFPASSLTIEDPELIAGLTEVADQYGIFIK